MNIIRPKKLEIGDTIGILATAGAVESEENVLRAKQYLETKGYNVVLSDNIFDRFRYLAGTDEAKIAALHDFFTDPSINAIVCMRGGYGAIRLINKIDYDIIRNNPKIFCGYSDVSALSAMMLKRANLMTFSGPLAQSDFGVKNPSEFTMQKFFEAVTADKLVFSGDKIYHAGDAEGITFGGNLATIASLCGQDFIPDEKFIFFVEELNESVYKIDKMMTQLLNIDKFRENIAGIILGDFLDVESEKFLSGLFEEICQKLKKPMVGGFKITHARDKITLPYGAKAILKQEKIHVGL